MRLGYSMLKEKFVAGDKPDWATVATDFRRLDHKACLIVGWEDDIHDMRKTYYFEMMASGSINDTMLDDSESAFPKHKGRKSASEA